MARTRFTWLVLWILFFPAILPAFDPEAAKSGGWVPPGHAEDLGPTLSGAAPQTGPVRILARWKTGISRRVLEETCTALGLRLVRRLEHLRLAVLEGREGEKDARGLVAALVRTGLVEYAEPDLLVKAEITPNDPSFSMQWGLQNTGQTGGAPDADIDAPEGWEEGTGSDATVVAVIDTGVDYGHPDLAAAMWVNGGEIPGNGLDDDHNGYIDDIHGIDPANRDSDPKDDHGHGTHCAGIIGATGNNALGVAGVNWNVKIMALKFLTAAGSGLISDAVICLDYLLMMKEDFGVPVRVASNSWGLYAYSRALDDALTAVGEADILFVAAAGNDNLDNDGLPHYPSSHTQDHILSVAATDRMDSRASFSNFGGAAVDLGAPGEGILSTYPNNAYVSFSGTSMATPFVAGAAALVWDRAPGSPGLRIKEALLDGVDPLPDLSGKTLSGGRLNLRGALTCLERDAIALRVLEPRSGFTAYPGRETAVTATLRDCGGAIRGAEITAMPGSNPPLTLRDDGLAPDLVAGDGIYAALWVPARTGPLTLALRAAGFGAEAMAALSGEVRPAMVREVCPSGCAHAAIQEALRASFTGDTILVHPGIYREHLDFQGQGVFVRAISGPEETILEGDGSGIPLVTFARGEGKTAVLEGFTLRNGNADYGGAILAQSSSPQISRCVFRNNSAPIAGGAIACRGGAKPLITACTFIGNASANRGPAIHSDSSSPVVTDSLFEGNSSGFGGALDIFLTSFPLIRGNTFRGNSTTNWGGAIVATNSARPIIEGNLIEGNTANEGGGIYLPVGTVRGNHIVGNRGNNSGGGLALWGLALVTENVIEENSAASYGGGIASGAALASLEGNLIRGNRVGGVSGISSRGGGIYQYRGEVVVRNSIIHDNEAGTSGGGLYLGDGVLAVYHSTLSRNSAGDGSGGIASGGGDSLAIGNSILFGDEGREITAGATVPVITNSDIGGGGGGSGNLDADPLFLDPAQGDFHLGPASPCRNRGGAGDEALPAFDFDGDPRVLEGTVDIGADEYSPGSPPAAAADYATTEAGVPVAIPILQNDHDPDGDPLTVVSISQPAHGTAALAGDSLVYTPAAGFTRLEVFAYTVADPAGYRAAALVTVTVTNPENHPPAAGEDAATVFGDAELPIPVLANDGDIDGDPLSIVSLTAPAQGTARRDGQIIVYTPTPGGQGTDRFTYSVSDGRGGTATAGVSILYGGDSPVVTIQATDGTAREAGADTGTLTVTRTGSTAAALTVFYSAGGTATGAKDYMPLPMILTIPAGSASGTIMVTPLDDTAVEGEETVTASLLASPGYAVGAPPAAVVTIQDDDLPLVTIVATDGTAWESWDSGYFTIIRNGPTTAALTVSYTWGGTAAAGVDYLALSGTVTIGVGKTAATVVVTPLDDKLVEGNETVVVTVAAGAGYAVGQPAVATVMINDDDPPLITVLATDATAREPGTDTGTFTVSRTGPTTAPLSTNYTVAGTATKGVDYTALSGTLVIAAGAESGTITVKPLDDALLEGDETVSLILVAGGAPYGLGSPSTAEVTIGDNDPVPVVGQSVSACYDSPGTVTVSLRVDYPGALLFFRYLASFPEGWSLQAVSGDGDPEIGPGGTVEFRGVLPASPLRFTMTIGVAAGQSGEQGVRGEAEYLQNGMTQPESIRALPDPLSVAKCADRPPVAVDDLATTAEDAAVTIALLDNDHDPDGDPLTLEAVTVPAHGTAAPNGDVVVYTPRADWHGTDSFTYTVSDGKGATAAATVVVTVTPVNDSPRAQDDRAATEAGASVTVAVLDNDVDVDGDPLAIASLTPPAHGTALHDGAVVTYTPKRNFTGEDRFTYTVSDGRGGTDLGTVTVTVSPRSWSSAYARILWQSGDLDTLRRFRDEVLQQTPEGRDLVARLYAHSEAALTVLLTHGDLLSRARDLFVADVGAVEALLVGRRGAVRNTAEIVAFLEAFGSVSPPPLRDLARSVAAAIAERAVAGRTYFGFEFPGAAP